MKVVVVGGGPAGMQAAAVLRDRGVDVTVVEKERLGGKLNRWHCLFPDFSPAAEVLRALSCDFRVVEGEAAAIEEKAVVLADGRRVEGDAIVVATGFELFPAERKEEYGYGIYDNVVTTADVEDMLNGEGVRTKQGRLPQRVAILHCVGSRDEKVCRKHCSRVCCITAVKQAIELHRQLPGVEVFNFYMDIRMFGAGYEELYRRAQEEYNVQFIRGRISEASGTIDNRVQIKAEDTLIGRPLRLTVDMLVLAVGMSAGPSFGLPVQSSGFIAPLDNFTRATRTSLPHVFLAGTAAAPMTLPETLANATKAALDAFDYINA